MKLKLDENLGPVVAGPLAAAGHDVTTVAGQGHSGIEDRDLLEVCVAEGRCLVTMDLEFANPLLFPPRRHKGVIAIRIRGRAGASVLRAAAKTLAEGLLKRRSAGGMPEARIWIVEPGRIRAYGPDRGDMPAE